jgi:hypothetical protein
MSPDLGYMQIILKWIAIIVILKIFFEFFSSTINPKYPAVENKELYPKSSDTLVIRTSFRTSTTSE